MPVSTCKVKIKDGYHQTAILRCVLSALATSVVLVDSALGIRSEGGRGRRSRGGAESFGGVALRGVALRGVALQGAMLLGAVLLGVALLTSGCGPDESGDAHFEQAERHVDAGRFREALYRYRRAARSGHPEAMHRLADALRAGAFYGPDGTPRGVVEQDTTAARRWYREAAHAYRSDADSSRLSPLLHLGELFYHGRGVPRDTARAIRLWQQAADRGLAEAQYRYGLALFEAELFEASFSIIRQAAVQRHASAASLLAFYYQDGYGTSRDSSTAVRWLRRAAAYGDSSAMYQLRALRSASTASESAINGGRRRP